MCLGCHAIRSRLDDGHARRWNLEPRDTPLKITTT
jgi:hypothetical protein